MRNRFLLGVAGVALAVGFGSGDVSAQWMTMPANGSWYVGGEGGWTWLNDTDLNLPLLQGSAKQRFEAGPALGLRVGYEWGSWRLEEEFVYRINGIKNVGRFAADGNRTSYGFMTNLLYGFDFGWVVTPHIGGGVGAVLQRDGWSNPAVGTLGASTSWNFGYQGIAGIRYNISPSLAFDVDYRYFGVLETDFTTAPNAALRTPALNYQAGNGSNNVMASFVLKFGAPAPVVAPPAPPAPPPVQRKVFLVFFDWDKYSITPEGMQILQQAAAAYRSGAPVQIQVTGYTDRSGSPAYNQRLSERRAGAVATALEGLGVPRSQMAVSGRGENDNRVPTADGVREPQNRRVEIIFP